MAKTKMIGFEEATVERLPVPNNLTRLQYFDLMGKYVDMIVKSKKQLKKCFATYKEELGKVFSMRRKLSDAEDRLIETIEMIEFLKNKK